ncbi:hypothetical protein [Streptomyces youssoufiensis]
MRPRAYGHALRALSCALLAWFVWVAWHAASHEAATVEWTCDGAGTCASDQFAAVVALLGTGAAALLGVLAARFLHRASGGVVVVFCAVACIVGWHDAIADGQVTHDALTDFHVIAPVTAPFTAPPGTWCDGPAVRPAPPAGPVPAALRRRDRRGLAALACGALFGPRWLLLTGLFTGSLTLAVLGVVGERDTGKDAAWPLRPDGPRAYAPALVHGVRAVDRATGLPSGAPVLLLGLALAAVVVTVVGTAG